MSDMQEKVRKSSSDIEASSKIAAPEPYNEKEPIEHHGTSEPAVVTKDGVKVHPQPTADPLDPLNWSTWRKNTILGIVMFK